MSDSDNVESLKVHGELVTGNKKIEPITKFGGVGEVFDVKEGCVTLEMKDANELNEKISREEIEKCIKRQKIVR